MSEMSNVWRRYSLAMLVLGYLLPGSAYLTAQNSTSPVQGPVLRSTTHLVQVSVIALDRDGHPARDLQKADFVLLDNGKPQPVSAFSSDELLQNVAGGKEAKASALPPNVFSNRSRHAEEHAGSVTVILFDALNTSPSEQVYVREQINEFLKTVQPEDHVAVYLLTTRLTVLNEFTQDAKSLQQAVERFQTVDSLILHNSIPTYISPSDTGFTDPKAAAKAAAMSNNAASVQSDLATFDRVQVTAQALDAIARHVSGIPGRKNLVWVSGSFPVSISFQSAENSPVDSMSQNFMPLMERLARSLNDSNLAVYPVDARGILTNEEFDASKAHPFSGGHPATQTGVGQDEQATMGVIAARTGGRASYNTNDISGAIRRAVDESKYTYLLGYYPDHGEWNGAFHEIKLHVKKPGITLRYRRGYFALADDNKSNSESQAVLLSALWSPVDATSIGIQAKVESVDMVTRKLGVRVRLDTQELRFSEVNEQHVGSVDAIYFQLGPGDAVLATEPRTYAMDFNAKDYQSTSQAGYDLLASLAIQPETRELRIVVRDENSGAIGSVTVPIERFIPPKAK